MWQFNPLAIILLILSVPLPIILYAIWGQPSTSANRYFKLFIGFVCLYAMGYALELSAAGLEGMWFWLRLEYLGQWATAWFLCFSLAYVGYEHLLNKLNLSLLIGFALGIWLLLWTNDQHGLLYSDVRVVEIDANLYMQREYGPLLPLWIAYLYFNLLVGTLILMIHTWRTHHVFKRPLYLLLIGVVLSMGGGILTLWRIAPHIDFAPFGIVMGIVPTSISLFHYKLLNIIPIGYHRAIQTMLDAVIVCDKHYRVMDVNPSALCFIPASLSYSPVGMLLGDYLPEIRSHLAQAISDDAVLFDRMENGRRFSYELRISALRNPQQQLEGYVIVVRDVSKRRELQESEIALRMEREKTRLLESFLHDMAHDLRTPLAVVNSSLYLLERGVEKQNNLLAQPEESQFLPNLMKQSQFYYKHIRTVSCL